jgi:Flp pilus assembly CpaF family ATPase
MRIFYYSLSHPQKRLLDVTKDVFRIGRGKDCDLRLESPFIAEEAAVLKKRDGRWELLAQSLNAIHVPDRQLYRGDVWQVAPESPVRIPPYTLEFEVPSSDNDPDREWRKLDAAAQKLVGETHIEVLKRMRSDFSAIRQSDRQLGTDELKRWEDEIERVACERDLESEPQADLLNHLSGMAIRGRLVEKASGDPRNTGERAATPKSWSRLITANAQREGEIEKTCEYFLRELGLTKIADLSDRLTAIDHHFQELWRQIAPQYHSTLKLYLALRLIKKQVKDLVFGYGPLEDLLSLPTISEIMVVDSDHIYVEKVRGRVENSGRRFLSDQVTETIIERIVSQVGRTIDKSRPLVDARLIDGSRVNAVIAPIAFSGPCLTIRKFPARKLLIDDLVKEGSMTQSVAEFLRAAVLSRQNILISGGTGTGKTTLLNCLSDFIPDDQRIVTIEDTVELRLSKEHIVQLETKEANLEGAGAYSIRDLVKNALRMRPDRIVVGECRGAEALDMLQAMNTGHDGALTTIHANTSEDVILRLEVMVQMASDLPITSIHRQISSAIDIIVQLHRLRDGRRAVVQVTEVQGINPLTSRVELRDLFAVEEGNDSGPLLPTGHLPSFMGELLTKNLINPNLFYL